MGKETNSRPPRGPHGAHGGDMAKDFKGSLAKLLKYNKNFVP